MIHIAPTCRASGHTRFTGRWIATRALERPWHDDKTFTGTEIQKDSIPQSIVGTDRTLYFGTSRTWVYIRYGSCAGRSLGRLSSSFGLWGEKTLFVVGVFGLRRDCHRGNEYVQGKGKQVSMSSANSASDSQTNTTQRVGVSDCGHGVNGQRLPMNITTHSYDLLSQDADLLLYYLAPYSPDKSDKLWEADVSIV